LAIPITIHLAKCIANANSNTYLEKVLQYFGNTENIIGTTATTGALLTTLDGDDSWHLRRFHVYRMFL